MTYEEIIKDELDHFYREKEFIKEEIKQVKNNTGLIRLRQRLIMVNEVIEAKEEKLRDLDFN
ncbi:hypothetical protein [Romboutsia timonensis]|uniref:hypothetical protein n=1 Tax=Romboutsia timonensis TaxID=1776391 RepID=UPI002A7F8FFE|nr:hypothetical protein [Romboutsia timonensis]MDY3960184.1 hypothetical protein [Romboutsia timonensis]